MLDTTITNPYSNESIVVSGSYRVNQNTYDGLDGFDRLAMTSVGDALFLTDSSGTQTLSNMEVVIAGNGNDIIDLSHETIVLGNTVISGGDGDDILWGNVGDDLISGSRGNDIINGGLGDDDLRGGVGSDRVAGGDGNDQVSGAAGDDFLYGNNGNDVLSGGVGSDEMYGGDGDDKILVGRDANRAFGGSGSDRFVVDFIDTITDLLFGGSGFDVLDISVLSWNDITVSSFGAASLKGYRVYGTDLSIPMFELVGIDQVIAFDTVTGGVSSFDLISTDPVPDAGSAIGFFIISVSALTLIRRTFK